MSIDTLMCLHLLLALQVCETLVNACGSPHSPQVWVLRPFCVGVCDYWCWCVCSEVLCSCPPSFAAVGGLAVCAVAGLPWPAAAALGCSLCGCVPCSAVCVYSAGVWRYCVRPLLAVPSVMSHWVSVAGCQCLVLLCVLMSCVYEPVSAVPSLSMVTTPAS